MKKVDLNNLFNDVPREHNAGFVHYLKGKRIFVNYSEMRKDVLKAVDILEKNNVKPGNYVGIYGENEYGWVLHDLACLYIGAISVPITDLGTAFLKKGNVELTCLVSNQVFDDIACNISMEEYKMVEESNSKPHQYDENAPFTMLFTSGTTGSPKAIEVRKKSFDLLAQNGMSFYGLTETDKLIAFLPLSIYLQRVYVYLGLMYDLEIVLANSNTVFNIIQKEKPTILIAIPHLFETVRQMFMAKLKSQRFGSLVLTIHKILVKLKMRKGFSHFLNVFGGQMRVLISGSAPLKPQTYDFYKNMGLEIYQAYGVNEIGIISANYPGTSKPGSVGKPLPEMNISFNSIGEILVESEYLTNLEYRIGTSTTYTGQNQVNTHDIGYLDNEGFLYITGRSASTIVLSNGVKIAPEVEEKKIQSIPGVRNCLVYSKQADFAEATISIEDPKKEQSILSTIKKLQKQNEIASEILKIHVLHEEFSAENGMLTKSLKKNRSKTSN